MSKKKLELLNQELDQSVRDRTAKLNYTYNAQVKSEILLNKTQRLTKVGGWEWQIASKTMTWTKETYKIHGYQLFESG